MDKHIRYKLSSGEMVNLADKINELHKVSIVSDAEAVVPSDVNDLVKGKTIGLYIGGAGDVSVVLANGTKVTFTGLSAGLIHPISVIRVNATGTTATGIVAVYNS